MLSGTNQPSHLLCPLPLLHILTVFTLSIFNFRCSSMEVEGSVAISPASERCQEPFATLAAAGAFRTARELEARNKHLWLCSKKLYAMGPEREFTRAADLYSSGSKAAERWAGRKRGRKYPLLVVHLKFIYSGILWCIVLASKAALLVGNFLTSCGLIFSKSATKTEERESAARGFSVNVNRQMNQNPLFLFILLPQRKDKNRTQHSWAVVEVSVAIGLISAHLSRSLIIRQRVSKKYGLQSRDNCSKVHTEVQSYTFFITVYFRNPTNIVTPGNKMLWLIRKLTWFWYTARGGNS